MLTLSDLHDGFNLTLADNHDAQPTLTSFQTLSSV